MLIRYVICCIAAFITFQTNELSAAQVYKWVDENGKVHYSDTPMNDQSSEITVKDDSPKNPVKPRYKMPKLKTNDSSNNRRSNSRTSTNQSNTPKQSCADIKREIRKAKKSLRSSDEMEKRFAEMYIRKANEMINNKRCR